MAPIRKTGQRISAPIRCRFPNLCRLLARSLRWNSLLALAFTLIALHLVDSYLKRTSSTTRQTAIYSKSGGVRRIAGRLKKGTEVHILKWDYRWYRVRTKEGKTGWIPQAAMRISNPWIEHFIPSAFSRNEKPNAIPFKLERHTVYYREMKNGLRRSGNEVYWRLTMPVLLLLAAAFCLGFHRPLFKVAASISFFCLLLIFSLFAAGDLYKKGYKNVSYFRQVSLRIPYSHKGMVFAPNNTWLLRLRAFLGIRKEVVLSSRATPANVKGSYLVTSAKGYTPGWALRKAVLNYANGPARLYYIPKD